MVKVLRVFEAGKLDFLRVEDISKQKFYRCVKVMSRHTRVSSDSNDKTVPLFERMCECNKVLDMDNHELIN